MTAGGAGPDEERPPPTAPRWLVWMIPARHRDDLLDDLREEYHAVMLPRLGHARARRWFQRQLLRAVAAEVAASVVVCPSRDIMPWVASPGN